MEAVFWISVVVLVGAAIFTLLVLLEMFNPFQRNVQLNEFPDIIRANLIRHENGGITKFRHRASTRWFSFERVEGSGNRAILALRIPQQTWAFATNKDVKKVFEENGFEAALTHDDASLHARIMIPVDDIWHRSSGAEAARAAGVLMQAVGIGINEKFAVEDLGMPSPRYQENSDRF